GREERRVLRSTLTRGDQPSSVELVRHEHEAEVPAQRLQAGVRLEVGGELLFTISAHAPLRADQRPLLRGCDDRNVHPLLLAACRWLSEPRKPREQRARLDIEAVCAVKAADDERQHILKALSDEVLTLVLL